MLAFQSRVLHFTFESAGYKPLVKHHGDFENKPYRKLERARKRLVTVNSLASQSGHNSRRNITVTDREDMHETIQHAIAAVREYFSSIEWQEKIPNTNKLGACHVNFSGRETLIEKPVKQTDSKIKPAAS